MSMTWPDLKIAVVKKVYRSKKVVSGYCEGVSEAYIKKTTATAQAKDAGDCAQKVLRFFHTDCATAVAALGETNAIRFYGNIDTDIADAFMDKAIKDRERLIIEAADNSWNMLEDLLGASQKTCVIPPRKWRKKVATATAIAACSKDKNLQPAFVTYNASGTPMVQQEEESKEEVRTEDIDFTEWADNLVVVATMNEEVAKTVVYEALLRHPPKFAPLMRMIIRQPRILTNFNHA